VSIVARYDYPEADGTLVGYELRHEPGLNGGKKSFTLHRADGSPGLGGIWLPIYCLPEVRAAIESGATIYFGEGAGKANDLRDALRAAGSNAAVTTIAGGANAPLREEHIQSLVGARHVVMLADSDIPGDGAATERAQKVVDAYPSCDVRIVDFYPDQGDGSDVADWLKEGHAVAELPDLVEAAPRVTAKISRNGTALGGERSIVTRALAEVETREVRWLWKNRIVRGEFGIIAGLPGIGKSYLLAAIASALSCGGDLPDDDERREPIGTLLLSLEDSPETVLRPRFERLGADLNRVRIIDGVHRGNEQIVEPFAFPHVALMDELLDRIPEIALVVIDPIASRLGGVDTFRSNDLRAILDPFIERLSARGVTVLAAAHTTKSREGHAMMKIEGSLGGFVGRARFVLGAGRDESGQCFIGLLKSNYGPMEGVPVVGYSIDATGAFAWSGESFGIDAGDLFMPPASEQDRSASEEARDAILDALRDGGELSAADLARRVRTAGVLPGTLNRVRSNMRREGKIERLGGGVAGPVRWRLASIDSHQLPQIRTLQGAKECSSLRKSDSEDLLAEVEI